MGAIYQNVGKPVEAAVLCLQKEASPPLEYTVSHKILMKHSIAWAYP